MTSITRSRAAETQVRVLIVFYSRFGLLRQLTGADALVVGAPAYFGSMATPVRRLFKDSLVAIGSPPTDDRSRPWRAPQLRNKIGAELTSSGTAQGGNEQALFMHLG